MDSLTQLALGAATAEAVAGKKLGNKAIVWGAIAGTLPDLDVIFIPFINSVQAISFHRGVSHSLFWISVAAPIVAFLVWSIYKKKEPQAGYGTWLALIWIAMFTHPLIDAMTTYGTQLFLPFSNLNFYHASIFVADLLFTIPLLVGLVCAWRRLKTSSARRWFNYAGLAVGCAYLLFCSLNKMYINSVFDSALKKQNKSFQRLITGPTPLNQILWYGVAEGEDDNYYLGMYSHLDSDKEIKFRELQKNESEVGDWEGSEALDKLRWFSDDFYRVKALRGEGDTLAFFDLRFGPFNGLDEDTVYHPFKFKVFKTGSGETEVQTLAGPQHAEVEIGDVGTALIDRIKGR